MANKPYFNHIICEVETSSENTINNLEIVSKKMEKIVDILGLTSVKRVFHEFIPQGFTIVFILSSSHLAVHSWPEDNYLHIDLLTCKYGLTIEKVKDALKVQFPECEIVANELDY